MATILCLSISSQGNEDSSNHGNSNRDKLNDNNSNHDSQQIECGSVVKAPDKIGQNVNLDKFGQNVAAPEEFRQNVEAPEEFRLNVEAVEKFGQIAVVPDEVGHNVEVVANKFGQNSESPDEFGQKVVERKKVLSLSRSLKRTVGNSRFLYFVFINYILYNNFQGYKDNSSRELPTVGI